MIGLTIEWWHTAGLILLSYLCGAVPFGLLIGRLKGVDVRTRGSCNIGATNVGRVLGRPYGILVFVLDGLKGFLPVTLGRFLLFRAAGGGESAGPGYLPYLLWVLTAVACVLGHMFPVYLKFKGGKGVATSLGVGLGIYPYYTLAGLAAFAVWGIVLWGSRYVSVSSIVAVVAFPLIFAVLAAWNRDQWGDFSTLWPLHMFGLVIAALVVYRHRANIGRLWAGTEHKIGGSSGPSK
ncbi:MAG: glycerol-3-phosphate 1-O-acyltransferase PlsY [Phycisphaerae bacterium]|jgi:glycerol-3-phosphate acyltransferase PlsY|nr:glycerol-3-phosphate 1-O-acyltransferase PlsY [Phycisphaerae bacterium]